MSHREIQSCPNHKQRLALESLGFVSEQTDDSDIAHWSGFGIVFSLPAKMELDHATAMRCVVQAAQIDGVKNNRKVCLQLHRELMKNLMGEDH